MLNLYKNYLRSTQPAHLTAFDKHYSLNRPEKFLSRETSSDVSTHFHTLIRFLLLTRYAIYFAEKIQLDGAAHPVWKQIQALQSIELEEHSATIVGHISCLNIEAHEREAYAQQAREEANTLLGHVHPLQATQAMLEEVFPGSKMPPAQNLDTILEEPAFDVLAQIYRGEAPNTLPEGFSPLEEASPSYIVGAAYRNAPSLNETLVDRLIATVTSPVDRGLVYLRSDGSEEQESYAQLFHRSKNALDFLRKQGAQKNDAVMIQINRPEEFVSIFWGALLGGMIPVPLSSLMTLGRGGSELDKTYRIYERTL